MIGLPTTITLRASTPGVINDRGTSGAPINKASTRYFFLKVNSNGVRSCDNQRVADAPGCIPTMRGEPYKALP